MMSRQIEELKAELMAKELELANAASRIREIEEGHRVSMERMALTAKAAALYAEAQKIQGEVDEYGKMVSRWHVANGLRITADTYKSMIGRES